MKPAKASSAAGLIAAQVWPGNCWAQAGKRLEFGLQAGNARPLARAGRRLDLRPQEIALAHPVGPRRNRPAGCCVHKAIADSDAKDRCGSRCLALTGTQLGAEQSQLNP